MTERSGFFMFKVFLLSVFGLMVFYVFFANEFTLLKTIEREQNSARALLGQRYATSAENRASNFYVSNVVNTGLLQQSGVTTEINVSPNKGVEQLSDKVAKWSQARMSAFWTMVFHISLRISYSIVWFPLMLMVFTPFIIDAFVQRQILKNTFGLTSPQIQWITLTAIPLIFFCYFLLLVAPFYIPPALTPVLMISATLLVWKTIANWVKRG